MQVRFLPGASSQITEGVFMEYNKNQKKEERKARIREMWTNAKYLVLDHKMIVLPIALVILVGITVLIAFGLKKDDKALEALENIELTQSDDKSMVMELNAYPAVNELIGAYYDALEAGDAQAALQINSYLNESEQMYIVEMGEFIDRFTTIEVYTKPGPIDNSYLAYVYYEVKFVGSEVEGPGMTAYYICCDEEGKYYINEGTETEEVTDYIEKMSLQDDVVELNNRVSVAFNDLIANDLVFSQFYSDLLAQLTIRVGEALVDIEPEEVTEEIPETIVDEPEVPKDIKAKATDVVNIRSSASQTADKKGKAQVGQIFNVIKIWENGWTEIEYEGSSGFIKSEYVSIIEEAVEPESGSDEVIGTVKANTTVNIRSSASQTSEKVGVVYEGEKLDLLEKRSDGWMKIKYKGKTAYVKSEFVDE